MKVQVYVSPSFFQFQFDKLRSFQREMEMETVILFICLVIGLELGKKFED